MQSASTRRPSASVLLISIVLPLLALTTSSTMKALVSIMLSVVPTTVITRIGSPSSAIAAVASITAAAPDMSNFMPTMLRPGLSV